MQGQKLKKGANVVLRLRTNGMVEVAVAESQVAWGSVAPGLKISSDALVSGFLDLYCECHCSASGILVAPSCYPPFLS